MKNMNKPQWPTLEGRLNHPLTDELTALQQLKHNIEFVLGHALYMKAIHGGKAKNDKIDSHKIELVSFGTSLL